jgi:hypothetical protein
MKLFQFVCQILFLVLLASPFMAFVSDTYASFALKVMDFPGSCVVLAAAMLFTYLFSVLPNQPEGK